MFSLQNPFLLIGLAALAIPVAIHIISRHRAKVIPFSSLVFLEESVRERVGIKRLQDLLTLLLRCLLIFLLVLAASKPLLKRSRGTFLGSGTGTSVVIVLDNSMSLGYREGESTRFERARGAASAILDTLQEHDRALVILTHDPEGRRPGWDESGVDRARRTLAASSVSSAGESFLFALDTALERIQEATDAVREIHVISDFQETAFDAPAVLQKVRAAGTRATVYAISVAQARGQNTAVEDVSLVEAYPLAGRPLTVTARLRNTGDKPTRETVLLSVDGARRASREIGLEPGRSQAVSFQQALEQAGRHEVEIGLQDEDPLPADNRRTLPVFVHQAMPVLVVDGGDLRLGALSETYYLKAALAPATGHSGFPIKPKVVTAAALGEEKIDGYPLVFLANVPQVDPEVLRRLEAAVQQGANLVFFLGERVLPEDPLYSESPLFPVRLGGVQAAPEGSDAAFALQVIEFAHPAVHRFRRGESGDLSQVHIRQYWELPEKEKATARVLASFRTGHPALLEAALGRGKVLVFASKCDADWSDFPRRPTFLPFIQQIVDYLGPTRETGRDFLVGQAVPFVFEFRDTTVPIAIETRGRPVIRLLASGRDRAETVFAQTETVGTYWVDIHRPDGVKEDLFAVNVDPRESDLALAESRRVADLVPGHTTLVAAAEDLPATLKRNREGIELWGNLLFFVLFVAVAECYLANRSTPVG
ncbi:MAG: BatA domain-containing protein [Planctomycetes bacterium]|nr:BatA domain-containing protein [Planctomycetota bacterium]